MEDPRNRIPGLRQEWIRYRDGGPQRDAFLRAGTSGAALPRVRLEVPHLAQARLAESVPYCAAMVLRAYGREADPDWLAFLLETDEADGTPGRRLEGLKACGMRVDFPDRLQFFRDGTAELDRRCAGSGVRLLYRWEDQWLSYVRTALLRGIPPILFVDLGHLYPAWRGLGQPHAVVLCGGDGRYAWVNDPARAEGPGRIGVNRLLDSLLPGQPLAALLSPGRGPLTPPRRPGGGARA
ncbi:MAG: hypothetical protein ACK47B_24965 [Armatimonadota bacterium]